jgi:phytoene dehydrogenase-like protein
VKPRLSVTRSNAPRNDLPAFPQRNPQRDIHEPFTRGAGDLLDHRFRRDAIIGDHPTATPTGAHVASMSCQHSSYNPTGGRDRRQEKQSATDRVFATVESYVPSFRACVVGHSVLGPLDPEEKLGLIGGEIFSAMRPASINCGPRDRC